MPKKHSGFSKKQLSTQCANQRESIDKQTEKIGKTNILCTIYICLCRKKCFFSQNICSCEEKFVTLQSICKNPLR